MTSTAIDAMKTEAVDDARREAGRGLKGSSFRCGNCGAVAPLYNVLLTKLNHALVWRGEFDCDVWCLECAGPLPFAAQAEIDEETRR